MDETTEKVVSGLILLVTILIISLGLWYASADKARETTVYVSTEELHDLEVRIKTTEDGIQSVKTQVNELDSSIVAYEPTSECISVYSDENKKEKTWYCTEK